MFIVQSRSLFMVTAKFTYNTLCRHIAAKVVSYEELKQMIANHNIQLYDVRQPEEVAEGRIPTSVNIPCQVETALKMDAGTFQETYQLQKPKRDDPNIVFQCRSGVRSATALETAWNLGYSKARHYKGGYIEWVEREGHCK
ncbi:thiosulfate:glutathione sulfurtransferase isoform X2 [Scyliorhinus canicula]|uniref:thiosulfate:glutathione sulfurtransferase isoform X2 n=1 Tax=Scyliorhinus canicula TaxID=7830 RepID=UPI0018F3388A|nr:thiosulfate:glutathione sulfurtransferase isoform X2 [Scyliorhinus canicula]